MRLFRRRSSELQTPAQPGLPSLISRIDWRRALPRLLVLLLIIAAIVLGVVWLVGALTGNDKPEPPSKKQPAIARSDNKKKNDSSKKTSDVDNTGSQGASQAGQPAAAPSATPTASTPSTASTAVATPATSQNGKLTDTGPGETLVLFAVATAAGTVAYQVNLRRRLN